ncbi:MAG: glycosyltransferase family 9 protein [Patescibacteria group bacterium]|nr:glycosyltransferase family 9 protein [Patescibacteria group bacterium]
MKIWPKYYYYKKKSLRIFFGFLDFIFVVLGGIKQKKITVDSNDKILIVNFGGIGDIVLTEPFFRAINQTGAEIWCLASPLTGQLLPGYVHRVFFSIPWLSRNGKRLDFFAWLRLLRQLKKEKFTLAVDLKGDPFIIFSLLLLGIKNRIGFINGGLGALLNNGIETDEATHKSLMNLKLLNLLNITNEAPVLNTQNDSKEFDIILHLYTSLEKNWPFNNWQRLIADFYDKQIAVIGGNSSQERLIAESLAGDNVKIFLGLKLEESVKIISKTRLFVGVDSGPAHIAAALGIPVISIFSLANNPVQWAPMGAKIFVFGEVGNFFNSYEKASPEIIQKYIKGLLS